MLNVVIGTPAYGGNATAEYMVSIVRSIEECRRSNIGISLDIVGGDALITRARARITADFLDQPAATHLMFIDADISFEPAQFMRLLKFDQDVVAAAYPVKTVMWDKIPARAGQGEPLREAGLLYTLEPCTGADLEVVDGFATAVYAATGFLLIKRAVIERMFQAFPEAKFRHLDAPRADQPARENLYALYDCVIDPDTGRYLSEDYAFSRRWRQIGGKIWVDLTSRLNHSGTYTFRGDATRRYGDLQPSVKIS